MSMFMLLFIFGLIILFLVVLHIYHIYTSRKRDAYLENYNFPEPIINKFKAKHSSLSDEDIALVIKGLKNYFYISSHSNGVLIMPSIVIDDLWHEFLLYSKEYRSFCDNTFGHFFHHSPNDTKLFNVDMARFLAWEKSCKLEGLSPFETSELPLIFEIDKLLKIEDGLHYDVTKERYWYNKYFEKLEEERKSNCASCG